MMFSCCSSYLKCSAQGFCIKQSQGKDCSYSKKLQDGHNFYDNDNLQRFYVLIDGQCYAVSTRNSMNILYKPDKQATALLKAEFDRLGLKYIEQYEFSLCFAEETSDSNPAFWDVYFQIGDTKFAIRNFNIRLFTQDRAHLIRSHLLDHSLSCSVVTHADGKTINALKNKQADKPNQADKQTQTAHSSKQTQSTNQILKSLSKPVDESINLPQGFGINHTTDPRWKPSDRLAKKGKALGEVIDNQIDMFGLIYGG